MRIKVIDSGYLTKRDTTNREIFTVRVLIYERDGHKYAMCLELGILGMGKDVRSAMEDLVVLTEDHFRFMAHSKISVKNIPAADEYFMAFKNHAEKHRSKFLPVKKVDYEAISKQYPRIFNPENPKHYEIRQPV